MQSPDLWVPPNRPPHKRRSFSPTIPTTWVFGQLGMTLIAGIMFIIVFMKYGTDPFPAPKPAHHDQLFKILAGIIWVSWIGALAIIQRRLLIKAHFSIPFWTTATMIVTLGTMIGVIILETQPLWSQSTVAIYWGFWFGIGIAQTLVLRQSHRKIVVHWFITGLVSSIVGFIISANLPFATLIIGGIAYIIATGSIIATQQDQR